MPRPAVSSESGAVTVVIPTRDRWDFLRTSVWSVLAQQHAEPKVVVVDDGSRTEAPDWLTALPPSRVTVLRHEESRGVSAARNHGLEHVMTEWVAFVDDDDAWAPGHLDAILKELAAAPAAHLAYAGHVDVDARRRAIRCNAPADAAGLLEQTLEYNAVGVPAAVILRTSTAREVGGFDTHLSVLADWDLWLRVLRRHPECARSPEWSVAYTRHADNMHFQTAMTLSEIPRLKLVQQEVADSLGVTASLDLTRWIASCHAAAGRRFRAAAWYAKAAFANRSPRTLARATVTLLGDRASQRIIPVGVAPIGPEGAPWLGRIRAIDDLSPDASVLDHLPALRRAEEAR